MSPEPRLRGLGLVPPPPLRPPPEVVLPFAPVRVVGDRALVSEHGSQGPEGWLAPPSGKVGAEVSRDAARLVALPVPGNPDRVAGWGGCSGGG